MLTLGIDSGSTTTKGALFDGEKIVRTAILPTTANPKESIGRLYEMLYNEDVEQATKCGLWRAAVTYDQNKDCTFSHYAISCIMAEMVPYTRTINKHNKAADNAIKCSDRNRRPMNSPDDVLCIDLLDFLARLPSDLKVVVDYRKVGYRSEEIGQILGITKRSVDRRLVKALRMWHDFIDDSSAA